MSDSESDEMARIAGVLVSLFDPTEIKWKPQAVSGSRAMAVAYVDARVIQDRLDAACGVAGWKDDYEFLPNGSVLCRLGVKLCGEWIIKGDVGSESDQPDGGDRMKAAVSDALKRAAVKWGIGRYLYRLPQQWCDFDAQKKRFVSQPQLPAWARGEKVEAKPVSPSPAKAGGGEQSASVVTTEQAKELQELMRKCGAAWHPFAERYHVTKLTELPAVHWDDARNFVRSSTAKESPAAGGRAPATPGLPS